jgi:hypothetical protein
MMGEAIEPLHITHRVGGACHAAVFFCEAVQSLQVNA